MNTIIPPGFGDGTGIPGGGLLGLSQRVPPQSPQAEQALLGALLANNKAYEQVSEFPAPGHLAAPVPGRIFRAIQRRIEAGQLADVVTLRPEFEHSGLLDEVGGPAYLPQLLSAMIGIINAGEYGRLVPDCWLRRPVARAGGEGGHRRVDGRGAAASGRPREWVEVGGEVVTRAFGAEAELDGKQQLEAAEQRLFDLSKDDGSGGGVSTLERALADAVLAPPRPPPPPRAARARPAPRR